MKCVAMVRLLSRASVKKKCSRRVNCPNQINEKPIFTALHHFFATFGLAGLAAALAERAETKPSPAPSRGTAVLVHQVVGHPHVDLQ